MCGALAKSNCIIIYIIGTNSNKALTCSQNGFLGSASVCPKWLSLTFCQCQGWGMYIDTILGYNYMENDEVGPYKVFPNLLCTLQVHLKNTWVQVPSTLTLLSICNN